MTDTENQAELCLRQSPCECSQDTATQLRDATHPLYEDALGFLGQPVRIPHLSTVLYTIYPRA